MIIVRGSREKGAQRGSWSIAQCSAEGSGRSSTSVLLSIVVGLCTRRILTFDGKLNQQANSKNHKNDVKKEMLVVVYANAIINPRTVAIMSSAHCVVSIKESRTY